MSEAPRSIARFFGEYVPAQLARLEPSLAGFSSPGAVVFEVGAAGTWSLRITSGRASVVAGVDPDPLVRIALAETDFEPIVLVGAERFQSDAPERQLVAARVLTVDPERARLLRETPGSVALKLTAPGGSDHVLTLTIGSATPPTGAADCEIACALEDFWALQSGSRNAFELLMDGKLKMTGKVELAMALAAALG